MSEAVTVTAPAMSRRVPAIPDEPGSSRNEKTMTAIPIGTLTRKIQCQSRASVKNAAENHADAPPAGGDEPDHAHRLRTLRRLGEQRHDQRERDRSDDGAAEALYRPRGDQELLRSREATGKRRQP